MHSWEWRHAELWIGCVSSMTAKCWYQVSVSYWELTVHFQESHLPIQNNSLAVICSHELWYSWRYFHSKKRRASSLRTIFSVQNDDSVGCVRLVKYCLFSFLDSCMSKLVLELPWTVDKNESNNVSQTSDDYSKEGIMGVIIVCDRYACGKLINSEAVYFCEYKFSGWPRPIWSVTVI